MGRSRNRQKEITFRIHGGKRRGAGRKPEGERAGVSHAPRPKLSGREPVLVTLKVRRDVWNLRARRTFELLLPALAAVMAKAGTRVAHYSVQRDHVHLILETDSATALSRRIAGLCVRIARRLNALMKRTGKVFADRFHERVLATPRQVRNALRYVLLNARHHDQAPQDRGWLDPYSSASAFDGWARVVVASCARASPIPISLPSTWLLKIGWRRGGPLIDPGDRPGPLAD